MVYIIMYAKRFGKRKATTRPRKTVRRKRVSSRKTITRVVKSVISRQAETKVSFDYAANQPLTVTALTTPNYKNLVPSMPQGGGNSNRIGNEIMVKSAYIRGHVNILPYASDTNSYPAPVLVKIWIASCKTINTTNLSSTSIATTFFDIGNSTTGMQGNILDIDLTPNKDVWTIHATKTIKVGAGSASNVVSSVSYFDNSSMTVPFYFNFGKHLGKLKYDDANACTNKNLFIIFQPVPANGSSAVGQIPAEFHYAARVNYQDL